MISILGSIMANTIAAFGYNLFFLYLTCGVFMFFMSTSTITRSLISKLVEENELATAFALHGILAKMTDTISHPIFSVIYSNTLDVFPGIFALVCAAIFIIIL